MKTGSLTPKSNNTVHAMRFSGDFGQNDGFASVLEVRVNVAGEAALTLTYKSSLDPTERQWSIMLNSEQRNALSVLLGRYQPRQYELIEESEA